MAAFSHSWGVQLRFMVTATLHPVVLQTENLLSVFFRSTQSMPDFIFPFGISQLLTVISLQERVLYTFCLLNISLGMKVHNVLVPFFVFMYIYFSGKARLVAWLQTPADQPEATRLSKIQQKGQTIAQFRMGSVFQLAVLSLTVFLQACVP